MPAASASRICGSMVNRFCGTDGFRKRKRKSSRGEFCSGRAELPRKQKAAAAAAGIILDRGKNMAGDAFKRFRHPDIARRK